MAALHPTENRAYRELFAFSRSLADHWDELAEHLPPEHAAPFRQGAVEARELIRQLRSHTAAYDLYGGPAALGAGRSIGSARRSVRNRFLEIDRATRFATSEVAYLVTTVAYLGRVAESRGDRRAMDFCAGWRSRLEEVERDARAAAVALGSRPDEAIQPYDGSPVGRAAQWVGFALGSLGEWTDRQMAKRG